jgi:hypothetical protein
VWSFHVIILLFFFFTFYLVLDDLAISSCQHKGPWSRRMTRACQDAVKLEPWDFSAEWPFKNSPGLAERLRAV